jgi:hypothetical protein
MHEDQHQYTVRVCQEESRENEEGDLKACEKKAGLPPLNRWLTVERGRGNSYFTLKRLTSDESWVEREERDWALS